MITKKNCITVEKEAEEAEGTRKKKLVSEYMARCSFLFLKWHLVPL